MSQHTFRPLSAKDQKWVSKYTAEHWGAEVVVVHQAKYWPAECPGFVGEDQGNVVGWITYQIEGDSCEIITLNSLVEGRGIGTALINLVKYEALKSGCTRLWLITTNNNTQALRFFQRIGFRFSGLNVGAVDEDRKLKPEIPLVDEAGIPIRDELVLEIALK